MKEFMIDKISYLNFENVGTVFLKLKSWLSHHESIEPVLDFSLIEYIDSAGVAMLVELRKIAQKSYNKNLILKLSPKIQQMIKFYEVEMLLE